MKGIGYGHPEWPHGAYKGEQLAITREDFTPSEMSWTDPTNLHIQAISKAVLTDADGQTHVGRGSFEQLFMGPHAPSGFKSILDRRDLSCFGAGVGNSATVCEITLCGISEFPSGAGTLAAIPVTSTY